MQVFAHHCGVRIWLLLTYGVRLILGLAVALIVARLLASFVDGTGFGDELMTGDIVLWADIVFAHHLSLVRPFMHPVVDPSIGVCLEGSGGGWIALCPAACTPLLLARCRAIWSTQSDSWRPVRAGRDCGGAAAGKGIGVGSRYCRRWGYDVLDWVCDNACCRCGVPSRCRLPAQPGTRTHRMPRGSAHAVPMAGRLPHSCTPCSVLLLEGCDRLPYCRLRIAADLPWRRRGILCRTAGTVYRKRGMQLCVVRGTRGSTRSPRAPILSMIWAWSSLAKQHESWVHDHWGLSRACRTMRAGPPSRHPMPCHIIMQASVTAHNETDQAPMPITAASASIGPRMGTTDRSGREDVRCVTALCTKLTNAARSSGPAPRASSGGHNRAPQRFFDLASQILLQQATKRGIRCCVMHDHLRWFTKRVYNVYGNNRSNVTIDAEFLHCTREMRYPLYAMVEKVSLFPYRNCGRATESQTAGACERPVDSVVRGIW